MKQQMKAQFLKLRVSGIFVENQTENFQFETIWKSESRYTLADSLLYQKEGPSSFFRSRL